MKISRREPLNISGALEQFLLLFTGRKPQTFNFRALSCSLKVFGFCLTHGSLNKRYIDHLFYCTAICLTQTQLFSRLGDRSWLSENLTGQ